MLLIILQQTFNNNFFNGTILQKKFNNIISEKFLTTEICSTNLQQQKSTPLFYSTYSNTLQPLFYSTIFKTLQHHFMMEVISSTAINHKNGF